MDKLDGNAAVMQIGPPYSPTRNASGNYIFLLTRF
jgi:hypothetical protein